MKKDHTVVSFSAIKKWLAIPEKIRKEIEKNVWCSSCGHCMRIEKYAVRESFNGILLLGRCKECGNDIVRVIEGFDHC